MATLGDTKAVSLTLLNGFIGDLFPRTTGVYNLGTSSLKWLNVYATTFNGALTGHASEDLPLAGGTMTGQIVLASNGFKTNAADGYSLDSHGNFLHLRNTAGDYFHFNNSAGTAKVSIYWETGNISSAGTYNGLSLTAAATGFTIAGGTTSKTLTVSDTITLKTGTASYLTYYSAAGTITGHGMAHFSDTYTSSAAGKNELVLGSATTGNGSAYGLIALYSTGSKGTYLCSATNSTAWYTATLLAKTGTIAYTDDISTAVGNYLPLTGGRVTGDITLYTAGTGNTPALAFLREDTLGGSYYDWRIINTGGKLTFLDAGTHTSNAWTTRFEMYTDTLSGKFSGPLTGNASSATEGKWLMNRGTNVTIADSSWSHGQTGSGGTNTANGTVWKLKWTLSGLTYTPSGGSATTLTDSGDLILWLAQSATSNALTVNMAIDGLIYALGGFKGSLTGTASNASALTNFKVTTTSNLGLEITTNVIGYVSGLTKANWNYQLTDGILYGQFYNTSWKGEIFLDYRTGQLSVRGKNNGTWQNWRRILDETNGATILGLGTFATKSSLAFSELSSHPTTVSGYGITDANKLSITKNNAATFYLMGTTTTVSDTATDITAVASTAMTYNGADKGTAKITLGTSTATSSAGGHYGELFLYSTGTNGTSIKSAANSTAAYVATLLAATGTIAYTDDISTAINNLDVTEQTNTASKTVDKISETNGKISVTFKNISITKSQVSDFPTTMTPASHTHGNILNGGTIGTAGKKKLVIVGTDNKVTTGAEIGTSTTTYLNNSGAWTTPANNAVAHALKNTTKFYVTGTESSTGSTGGDTFDDGVYVTTTAGQLNAVSYLVGAHVMLTYNTTDQSLDFSFV